MTRPTSRFGTVALTTVTALALALPASAIAITDGDKLDERSETTWRVLPDAGVVVLLDHSDTDQPTEARRLAPRSL